ncbi:uncharacterized protein LOC118490288 [Helianthus annuus]|uniref:uncharacterized protein LOC118490288 n=1 Tax=Helianthus annuus TaxID=4232 RepID=UPI0016530832|nr:uncharacterized protein LOC118490288 [Helianthus annuus]
MDENNVSMLNNLDWRSKLFTIKVKVLRLWMRVNPKREGEILAIEMVVMDEQGTKMQATVWNKFMKKHEILLQGNESYYIYKSQLFVIKSNFKHFDKQHAINLNFDTFVKKCENFDGSVYGIRLASFESIKAGEVDVNYRVVFFTDFIGYVDEWSEPEATKTNMGKDSKYMNLQLLDEEGIKLNCTLWDEYCDEMFGYIQSHKEEVHVVLLVQFGSFNKYKGLWRRYVKQPVMPCEVIVVGTVLGIDDKDDWYYLGCEECNRKVETTLVIDEAEDGAEEPKVKQVLVCSNPECPKEVVGVTPIFRIPIRVQDSAAIASLTLFDREARKMFGMTAIQLLEKSKVEQASSEEKTMPYSSWSIQY